MKFTFMNLPPDYYHCFLGNGLDAVLVGYTGSMVADRVGVDRCQWYKADRYYPEDRLVKVAGRFPMDRPLEHAEGSGWYEVAPLGRSWYEVLWHGNPLAVQQSHQRFEPHEGTLYSQVDYGPVRVEVTTFLHATRSILIERYHFDQEVEFRAWMGPGVWVEEGWDTNPFDGIWMRADAAEGHYDLRETQGMLVMRLDPTPTRFGTQGNDRWLSVRGRTITKYFAIFDNRQGPLDAALLDQAMALGYAALRQEHLTFWRDYFAASHVWLPDAQFQRFYEASMYHFKAMQNRDSGGLPVNNLRRTWSSHIFWDAYFIQRALLEANHRAEALEACRFFQRTLDHARRHAREEFGCDGLKWDWEITHDGRKAYGVLLHMKDQVHNNASYSNMIWQYYTFTQDREMLREFYPLLEGIARFFLGCVAEETARGWEIRSLVGVHESPERVRNEGITLTGTIAILEHVADAARLLGGESDFSRRCAAVAKGLRATFERLYNGRYFTSAEGSDHLNMSSLAPIYPMQVVEARDGRSLQTARAFLDKYGERMVGHGGSKHGFPWSAGVLATIFARQGEAETAWATLERTRPAICCFGGMSEVVEDDGRWNMQYFGTAQGAVCTALHHLLLQSQDDEIHLFPAVPSVWPEAHYDDLLAAGLALSATFDRAAGRVVGRARNLSSSPLTRRLSWADKSMQVTLTPGEERRFEWKL